MSHRLFRRFALALATAQIVVYAAGPALESLSDRAPGPIALERTHTSSCVVLHAPDSCLVCQLLTTAFQPASSASLPVAASNVVAPAVLSLTSLAPRAPPTSLGSRAPPLRLA